jgi:hypothetical protein
LKRQLSGSKSQADLESRQVKINAPPSQNFKKTNAFKSGVKRRRSLSRTKSFVHPSTSVKQETGQNLNNDQMEYNLFENNHLATSEFRKHEMEVRMGHDIGTKSQKSFRSHQIPKNDSESCIDDEIDCISTTIRKFNIFLILTFDSTTDVSGRTTKTEYNDGH